MPPHLTPPTWIPCTHSLTISTHSKHLSPPPLPPPPIIYWVSTTHSGVENLPTPEIGQGNLELTALPHSLDNTRNKMLFCPHNMSTLLWVKPRAKYCYCSQPWGNQNLCSQTTLLPQQAKWKFIRPLILNLNFIKTDLIFGFLWEFNLDHLITISQLSVTS